MTKEEFIEKYRKKFLVAAGFGLLFLIGFGAGRATPQSQPNLPSNYSGNVANKPGDKQKTTNKPTKDENPAAEVQLPQPTSLTTADPTPITKITSTPAPNQTSQPTTPPISSTKTDSCLVKGNDLSKIYHLPGDRFYSRLKKVHCFADEAAALAAGFRKSKK